LIDSRENVKDSPAKRPTTVSGVLKNIGLLLAVCAISAFALEGAVRLFVDNGQSYELEMWKYATDVKVRDRRPEFGHRHGPNRHAELMGFDVRTNQYGARGPAISQTPAPGVARIDFAGDSTTFGWGVAEDKTFAHQVIEELKRQGYRVDGFNQGVGNYNTRQEYSVFVESGLPLKPDIIALTYFINDGEPMPTYNEESWLDLHSAAWIVLRYRLDALIRSFGERPDWKAYYRNLYADDAPGWKDTQKALGQFATLSKEKGIKLLVFHLPELHELKPYPFNDVTEKVRKVVEATGTPFIDMLPAVENVDPSSLWVTVPDPHPNGKADTIFTGVMVEKLRPLLEELCRSQNRGCKSE